MTQFGDILPTMGIECRFVDPQDPQHFAAQIDENTRCLFCETCANPSLQVAVCERATHCIAGRFFRLVGWGLLPPPPCNLLGDADGRGFR
jgi:cystathionine beta-lyase/cystathionine gamma-synthase